MDQKKRTGEPRTGGPARVLLARLGRPMAPPTDDYVPRHADPNAPDTDYRPAVASAPQSSWSEWFTADPGSSNGGAAA